MPNPKVRKSMAPSSANGSYSVDPKSTMEAFFVGTYLTASIDLSIAFLNSPKI